MTDVITFIFEPHDGVNITGVTPSTGSEVETLLPTETILPVYGN